jgi:hypothetical protein
VLPYFYGRWVRQTYTSQAFSLLATSPRRHSVACGISFRNFLGSTDHVAEMIRTKMIQTNRVRFTVLLVVVSACGTNPKAPDDHPVAGVTSIEINVSEAVVEEHGLRYSVQQKSLPDTLVIAADVANATSELIAVAYGHCPISIQLVHIESEAVSWTESRWRAINANLCPSIQYNAVLMPGVRLSFESRFSIPDMGLDTLAVGAYRVAAGVDVRHQEHQGLTSVRVEVGTLEIRREPPGGS